MALIALGLSHHNAPVEVRSQLAFTEFEAPDALARLRAREGVREAALLSTCNRTEVLGVLDASAEDIVPEWWAAERGVRPEDVRSHLRVHRDLAAIRHSLRVASGLDSLVIGEPQILGQMKQAYAMAEETATTGPILSRLFQHAFAVAKLVRSQTEIGAHPVSVAYAAVQMAKRIFTDLSEQTAVLIGAGETMQLIARHLRAQGVTRIIVANRTIARAEHLARDVHGYAIALADLPERLSDADLLVASTASRDPVVGIDAVRHALPRRRHKPMCMIDLAVPRDIDARVAGLDDVFLYTVDDLRQIIARNMDLRQQAAEQAEALVADRADAFNHWLESREVAGTIRALRASSAEQRDDVLARARRRLAAGEDPEAVLEYATRMLANRLAHAPSRALRTADPVEQALLKSAARKLFDLSED
ncbi:glutamyl-tRNA reductase [Algiphilus sp.]|uniref:glutamyl-tRNA reductase n=1 Tax=Algiphilus sp. TaxID=1872431 RepID=UPI0025C6A694|nr:glutamyl-tRNA reductase [Algiphilus sp.]MCK5770165.1 glutamyl-tRNA reductase [Algiphilus sp.]